MASLGQDVSVTRNANGDVYEFENIHIKGNTPGEEKKLPSLLKPLLIYGIIAAALYETLYS